MCAAALNAALARAVRRGLHWGLGRALSHACASVASGLQQMHTKSQSCLATAEDTPSVPICPAWGGRD